MKKNDIKAMVKKGYADIAAGRFSSCCGESSCCGSVNSSEKISKGVGYSDTEMDSVPEGSNLGLGCGNPVALSSLKKGEKVLDLGSGAGFDCLLASKKVGDAGRVIGIDMTPEMVKKARSNALKGGYRNVEFRLGEIENLPVAENGVDAVISNCVINLSPEKTKVFKEIYRVLKPGGRFMISDLVLIKPLPKKIMDSVAGYIGCLSGAIMKKKYLEIIKKAGFKKIKIIDEKSFPVDLMLNDTTAKAILKNMHISGKTPRKIANSVLSISICGYK